ncbi:ribosome biogenesis protein tsr1 [Glugoides intestinalis]
MKRTVIQRNKNKQKQELKSKKVVNRKSFYSSNEAYMNITSISLCKTPMELELKLPFNFILRDATTISAHEITYLCRASDLLILTVTSTDIDNDMISLIKRSMPTAVIAYAKKVKGIAKAVAKSFGSARTCEFSMLDMVLENLETENTHIATVRPFMIPKEARIEEGMLIVEGFMKNSLKTDKVVINGLHHGIIEEIIVDNSVIRGDSLNSEENETVLDRGFSEEPVESEDASEESIISEEPEYDLESEEEMQYNCDFEAEEEAVYNPDFDLINKYSEYRGIRNLATCKFKDQRKPEHYKEIVFIKNTKYVQSQIKNRTELIPKNKNVVLKIRLFTEIQEAVHVIFNLFEYETRKSIYNFDFTSSEPLPREVLIDNGFMLFTANSIVTRNLNNNMFEIEPELNTGVVSFIGPINLYNNVATILPDGVNSKKVVRLLNGRSEDRIFFESVELCGKPIKICKSYVVVKGMFHNKEQVEYFSNIKVEAKNGVSGFIKKPLGTKGLFKAYFAQVVKHGDNIKMRLYKRVFL